MGRIVIVPADQSREYIHPIPGDHYGMRRFLYAGAGNYVMPLREPQSLDPVLVRSVVEELQDVVPLGDLAGPEGDYYVFLVDGQLLAGPDPTSSFLDGERHEGWIILAGNTANPRDLIGHEFTHELMRSKVDRMEEEQFFTLINQLRGSETDPAWEKRPQERLAEYASTALMGMPLDQRMPELTPAILERVKAWAQEQFVGAQRAEVVIEGREEPQEPFIVLQVGNPVARVEGKGYTLDSPPVIVNDRTMVPLRFIAEAFRCEVEWVEKRRLVLINWPNTKPLPK